MASAKPSNRTHRPSGVLFLCVLAVISGLQMFISSLWSFAISANADKQVVSDALSRISPALARSVAGIFLILALVFLILALSSFFLARGYYMGRERARSRGRLVSAFAIVWAFLGILFLPERLDTGSPWWTILFNTIIVVYLGRESVRAYFRHGQP